MLNIRKRFFLLLTIVGVLLGFTACVSSKDTVRVSFDKPEYTVKVGQVLDITPIIEKGSNVEKVTIEYSSTNPDVATYVDGKLTGLQAGEAEIRIVCSEKPVAFDVATVKVVENEIPDVQFIEPQKSMIKGTTQTLQYKFVPEYASANMTFESANPDIATVDENGVISAVKAGKATIIARAIDVNDTTQHKDYVFTIEVIEADFAINYVLNDGVNNPDNPAGYNILTLPLEILAPTKEAYRFLGWYDNAEFNGNPITEIAAGTTGDVTLYAKWELVIYSIVYELNGGTNAETNPDTYNIENLPLTLADPTKAGYTFLGWYNGETKVTEVPAGTTGEFKVEAKWQINEYTISYDLAEGAWEGTAGVGSYTIESEDIVLPNAVRNGYKFLGWYNVDEKVETITKGSTGNLELVAKWEIEKYSINYELNGGAFDSVAEISKDAKHTFTISDYLTFAAATGYKNALVNKAGGRWWAYVVLQKTAVPGLYKVVQMANGSTKITEQYDMLITWHSALKDTAAKTILDGMLNNSAAYVGSYIKVSNVPAEETADCNITAEVFDKDAIEIKDSSVKSYTIEDEVTLATPTKEGQVFLGWYIGENKVETIAKGSTGEVTVTAKWYNPNAELTLNCELNGGTLPEGAVIKFISKDGLATLPTPEKAGYTFKGWYADSECTQLVTSIEAGLLENPTVYAAWQINTYKITYETNGGEFQVDKTVPLYDSFEDLVAAFLSDYASFYNISGLTAASFFGKTNQYGPYGFFKNAEMNAKWGWLAEYILTVAKSTNYVGKANLVMDAGAANYNKYMRSNLAAFLQKAKLTNVTPVPMNFVNADCDALWAACPTKEIKVGIAAKYEYTVEELPLELATPVKGEAKFIGWYLNADLKNGKVEKLTIENLGDIKLYARWSDSEIEFDTYEIEYELNGGTLPEDAPKQYVEEAGVVLKDPTQAGYTFKGWYLDAECTQKVTEISKESKGNVKLYAAWEAIEYKVTFEVGEGKLPTEQVPVGKYEDYIDFVKDFIVDFNKHSKKTVAADGSDFFARSWMADGSSAGYNFLVSDEYKAKWGWVLTLINQVRVANGKAELTSTDGQAEARGEIHNLLNRTGNGNNGGNAAFGCDYTSADVNEQVWEYIEKVHYVDKVIDLVYTVEQLPITLPNPTAPEGKKFAGWYLNAEYTGEVVNIIAKGTTGDIKLYAKYVDEGVEVKGKINYELFGATLSEGAPTEYVQGTVLEITATATKAGYIFKGWYTNAECTGEAITEISASQKGDITLYARWENWTFKNINYELNGGTLPEGAANKYPLTQGLKELPTPTKDGFKFLGWYGNAECTGDVITSISADATEDVNLWALWLDLSKSYNITYVLNGGNSLYADRASLVADLLNDLNTTCGKSITGGNFTSSCRKPEFTKFITDDTMWAKWKWLFQYLADTDKHEKAADVYKGVLENRTVSDDFWFLTRDFAGFVNKTVGNFYYSVNAIDFTTFAAGDGFWNLIQTEISDPKAVELITPNYPYYEFEGWYDNPEFTGERVLVPSKDGKLYAKWSKKMATLTYSIGDVDATVTNETIKVHASDSFVLETPTYDPKYLRFNGWYKEAECINPITEISEYTTQDITVYASWTEIDGYTINYVLNGGSLIYQDRDAVIADFIKDYNEAIGTSYASAADIPTSNFADINYHTFYTKVLSDGTVIRDKWLWLAQYLLRLSQRDLAGNNCNVLGLSALVNNTAYAGDAVYGISYAFRSFLKGTTLRPGSSYASVDYTVYENAHGFWNDLSAAENGEYLNNKGTVTLPTAYLENYKFAGWFTNAECTGEPVTTVSDTATLYAKYVEATPVESVTITNKITEIKRYETYQLQWQVLPTNANIQAVKFESSDTRVATVDVNGLVTAVSEGDVEIKVISLSPSGKSDSLKLNVYAPDHFKISYETVSYVKVGGSIKLNASYIKRDGSATELEWSSVTPEIATVDENGKVTAVKEGLATIRVSAKGNADIKQDFVVTVLPATLSKELQEVVDAHESNAFIRWDLGIGAGGPAYYRDIYGSVSKVLYNDALVIDTKYKATQDGISTNHGAEMSAVDFITVHYTGNMSPKADASANASYFAGGGGGTSIHYVTGNDGVFYCLDEKYVGYHAGDSSMGERKWIKTGIKATSDDPETPVWGISSNSKFTLNGQETIVNVPEGTTDATKKVTGNTFVYNGKVQNCINDMGLAWKIVDGEYYMLDTWWCYSQVSAGRICNYGGNRNSIGIESAVNPESDLWYTWQRTAQLVADIMVRHNLDITRVVGHHFWTAKDCPQPLLENNLEIWDIFIESVKHEYKLITDFKDTKFAFTCDSDIIGKNGRVATQPLFSQIVTYTVEVNGEKITLATMVEGRYNKK